MMTDRDPFVFIVITHTSIPSFSCSLDTSSVSIILVVHNPLSLRDKPFCFISSTFIHFLSCLLYVVTPLGNLVGFPNEPVRWRLNATSVMNFCPQPVHSQTALDFAMSPSLSTYVLYAVEKA